jgi:hypothetical protein
MKTSTALSVLTSSVQPKPTRQEIVRAMLIRQKQHFLEYQKGVIDEIDRLEALLLEQCLEANKCGAWTDPKMYVNYIAKGVTSAELRVVVDSPEIQKTLELLGLQKKKKTCWDEKTEKAIIEAALKGKDRSLTILESESNVKVIDTFLSTMGAPFESQISKVTW